MGQLPSRPPGYILGCQCYGMCGGGGTGRVIIDPPDPPPPIQRRYACFNTILDLSCDTSSSSSWRRDAGVRMLVFERARYGRNDTAGALRCRVPYTRNCDFDVQHSLSQACGGRQRCSLAVNTKFFGDPCGYNEFLTVVYRCVQGTTCLSRQSPQLVSYTPWAIKTHRCIFTFFYFKIKKAFLTFFFIFPVFFY